jgi:hypothetical protein
MGAKSAETGPVKDASEPTIILSPLTPAVLPPVGATQPEAKTATADTNTQMVKYFLIHHQSLLNNIFSQ